MTKDETRARTAFEAARAQQEKIVQAQPATARRSACSALIDAALGRKELALDEGVERSRSRRWKKMSTTALRPSVFRITGRRGRATRSFAFAATGSWTACSRRVVHAELRRLGNCSRSGTRSRGDPPLRENRRFSRAERVITTPCPFIDSLPSSDFRLIEKARAS